MQESRLFFSSSFFFPLQISNWVACEVLRGATPEHCAEVYRKMVATAMVRRRRGAAAAVGGRPWAVHRGVRRGSHEGVGMGMAVGVW